VKNSASEPVQLGFTLSMYPFLRLVAP
jgi:hypothetical protein